MEALFVFPLPKTAAVPRLIASALLALLLSGPGAAVSAQEFGGPPSGEVPILFNDHHVYAKPDIPGAGSRAGRAGQRRPDYVPLRSMFEQMEHRSASAANDHGRGCLRLGDGARTKSSSTASRDRSTLPDALKDRARPVRVPSAGRVRSVGAGRQLVAYAIAAVIPPPAPRRRH